jgi:hypothetical protein
MTFLTFSYRLGISFAAYGIRSKITIVFTYIIVSSILLFSKLPCPEITFLLRKSRDPGRRYYITVIFVKDSGIIQFN